MAVWHCSRTLMPRSGRQLARIIHNLAFVTVRLLRRLGLSRRVHSGLWFKIERLRIRVAEVMAFSECRTDSMPSDSVNRCGVDSLMREAREGVCCEFPRSLT